VIILIAPTIKLIAPPIKMIAGAIILIDTKTTYDSGRILTTTTSVHEKTI